MEQITIGGKQYNVAMNFATVIAYEALTDQPFDLSGLNKQTGILSLLWCMISANNEEGIDFNEMAKSLTSSEFVVANEIIAREVNAFYNVPDIADKHVKKSKKGEEKNA